MENEGQRAREIKIPAALLLAGIAGILAYAFVYGGKAGLTATLLGLTVQTVVGVAVLLLGCFIAAKVLEISFGQLHTAILKLAAIYVFPVAVGIWIPIAIIDWLVSLGIYFCLVTWLFELEGNEPLYVVAIFFTVKVVVAMVMAIFLTAVH